MLKVKNRLDLEALKGGKAAAPKPEPAPEQATPQMAQIQASLDAMAANLARAAELIAAGQAKQDKKMEAIVHRDSNGRMARVEITVV